MNILNITREIATKVLSVVDAGLVRGVGRPKPGQMCMANDIQWLPWAQTEKLAQEMFGEPGKAAQLIEWTKKRLAAKDGAA